MFRLVHCCSSVYIMYISFLYMNMALLMLHKNGVKDEC